MSGPKDYLISRTPKALRRSIRQVVSELKIHSRHRAAVGKSHGMAQKLPLKLNLGCGPNKKTGWVNIDLFDAGADLQLDLRERWPFPDGSVDYIYSEHVFEHFEFSDEVPHFLSEAMRLLKPGGTFDVGVPDTEWPLLGYGKPDHDYWPFAPVHHPEECETQLDHFNYHFRQGGEHKYAWDEVTLRRTLAGAGFVSIARRGFDPAFDTESRQTGTLYMRALKPHSATIIASDPH